MMQALEELQTFLPTGMVPDENLVKTMMEKVVAETRMKTLLQEYEKQWSVAGEDCEGKTGCETSGSWFKQFRCRRISKDSSYVPKSFNYQL